jgi:hypothetical protein
MAPLVGTVNKHKKGKKNLVFLICGYVFWFFYSLPLLQCNTRTPSLDCLVLVYTMFSFWNHIDLNRKNANFFFVLVVWQTLRVGRLSSSSRSTHLKSYSTFSSSTRIYTIPICLSQQLISLLYRTFKLKTVKLWLSKCKWSHYMDL